MLLLFLGILLLTQFSHHPFWSSPRHGELEVEMQFLRRSWCFSWVTTSSFFNIYISGMFHMLIVHLHTLHIITMPDKIGRCSNSCNHHEATPFPCHGFLVHWLDSRLHIFQRKDLVVSASAVERRFSPGWRPKTIWNWSSRVVESSPGPSTVDSSWRKKKAVGHCGYWIDIFCRSLCYIFTRTSQYNRWFLWLFPSL
jgi:hypothetical protein